MLFLRSLVFNIAFYLATAIQLVFWTPVFFFLPRRLGWKVVRLWGKINLWLQYHIVGTRFDFRGIDNIPQARHFIVAAKHQSSWETYTILLFLKDPSYILKRELMFIPLFGWFMAKMNVIPVRRGRGGAALAAMTGSAREQYQGGREIIIYPEGTRKASGAEPAYKYGITHLYSELGATILPVALNSGLFWPRQSFLRHRGTIVMEFLPVIEAGLTKDAFAAELQDRIETATGRLNLEAATGGMPPPLALELVAAGKIA
ncbi:MAG: 1-acyl-sn-glycerol-3-phosphate acyltransferase [Nitratireductor sp.]|nr:1-acyl-sn-glycerol-3-phosphate acyltransferase [Nitratireductor sp.]MCB1455869.1 1-acyl-sn-glycerol-3-phosphate acyltransferase [Nitratireductor sp.]MCB1459311.1 1-acyl-sn-glycerol-3-phosphate acyltransferase [Nitratireductor sp.]